MAIRGAPRYVKAKKAQTSEVVIKLSMRISVEAFSNYIMCSTVPLPKSQPTLKNCSATQSQ